MPLIPIPSDLVIHRHPTLDNTFPTCMKERNFKSPVPTSVPSHACTIPRREHKTATYGVKDLMAGYRVVSEVNSWGVLAQKAAIAASTSPVCSEILESTLRNSLVFKRPPTTSFSSFFILGKNTCWCKMTNKKWETDYKHYRRNKTSFISNKFK